MPPIIDPPLIIAHAGGAALGPENTLAAIRASLDAGADAIEIDVWNSSDGIPVLIHDSTVERTTGGTGKAREMTLEQLQALDAGSGESIPTLRDTIELIKGRARLNIEIKDLTAAPEVIEVVRSLKAQDDVWISSFSSDVLDNCRWLAPEIERSLLFAKIADDASRFILYNMSNLVITSLSPSIEFVEKYPLFVELCHRRGVRCFAWTVDGAERLLAARALDVDGVITNDPAVAREALVPDLALAV